MGYTVHLYCFSKYSILSLVRVLRIGWEYEVAFCKGSKESASLFMTESTNKIATFGACSFCAFLGRIAISMAIFFSSSEKLVSRVSSEVAVLADSAKAVAKSTRKFAYASFLRRFYCSNWPIRNW